MGLKKFSLSPSAANDLGLDSNPRLVPLLTQKNPKLLPLILPNQKANSKPNPNRLQLFLFTHQFFGRHIALTNLQGSELKHATAGVRL
ncbi:hypothetical protein SESBI_23938 [Sesbania bispinosa]|nr:hypothetical protein SESBI_23938 [Sesbania bispinosa]